MKKKKLKPNKADFSRELSKLRKIFVKAAVGDFSQNVPVTKVETPFSETFAGVRIMQEAIREKINEIESVNIKLKDAQNIAYIGNWEWNLSSNRLICSSELFKIFSITAENFSGAMKDFLILIHPIDRNRIKRIILYSKKSGQPFDYYHHIVRTDGTVRTINGKGRVVKAKNGKAIKILGTVQDVTSQKILEQELKMQNILINSTEYAVYNIDNKGIISDWNKGAQFLYGYKDFEMIGKPVISVIPIGMRTQWNKLLKTVIKGKSFPWIEFQHCRKGDQLFDVLISLTPDKNQIGKNIGISVISRDITEKKQYERNLQFLIKAGKILISSPDFRNNIKKIARLAVDNVSDWFSVELYTPGGQAEEVALEHKKSEKIRLARKFRKKYSSFDITPDSVRKALFSGQPVFYPEIKKDEIDKMIKDGQLRHEINKFGFTSAIIFPIRTNGKTTGRISLLTDESRKPLTHNHLVMMGELVNIISLAIRNADLFVKLEKAVTLRDDFISIASHELKTPLTSLIIYLELLNKKFNKNQDKSTHNYFPKMIKQVDKLKLLVNDLLEISKIQHGKLEFEFEKFDLSKLIQELKSDMSILHNSHNIEVRGKINRQIYGDPFRINQVLTNLIQNAVKFSPGKDKIIITLKSAREKAYIAVTDFGIGIDREHHGQIFERFFRVGTSPIEHNPGLGIGLYISREIIERHGGQFSLKSRKGKGSVFSFTIPFSNKPAVPSAI
ncbi:hypothetical protein A3B48_02065 [Candidatus Gottesmanbacteria bacterium RIFCSPLOWO2_01_FULL_40_10]|uniref:histidine kinase n=1 Tax=Candidatus Gottesmanbacteria bacterium RIFCSPHIGHO2_01_FULL_40_15 TaxID=1798376 RepID=A0A1F5Z6X0_9BACT|nr:MAG: hypothetical protein A2777_02225 [Candidatus Gottesmanbacteria bacterium RIFCSPHIGHO2_01_FULL_40_15]OGG22580.1 MAG: hypothetical protein A3B48_02065 [Candidatus Gottesmanbacteria bacterium RIFCSPLOWO2_01_FULL_40_10]OGG32619.1 MAG: hypothetical protein A3I80_06230 [Candidatus Gottesmanbacteria bacterium RIFCSPLOWO2_02_FULL_40_10]